MSDELRRQAFRLLREQWPNASSLAEELYSILAAPTSEPVSAQSQQANQRREEQVRIERTLKTETLTPPFQAATPRIEGSPRYAPPPAVSIPPPDLSFSMPSMPALTPASERARRSASSFEVTQATFEPAPLVSPPPAVPPFTPPPPPPPLPSDSPGFTAPDPPRFPSYQRPEPTPPPPAVPPFTPPPPPRTTEFRYELPPSLTPRSAPGVPVNPSPPLPTSPEPFQSQQPGLDQPSQAGFRGTTPTERQAFVTTEFPAHIRDDRRGTGDLGSPSMFGGYSGRERIVNPSPISDGPITRDDPGTLEPTRDEDAFRQTYYDLRFPVTDWDSPRPAGGAAGVPIFVGKVVSGDGARYLVKLYPNGPDNEEGDIVEVRVPMIHPEEKIEPDTWLWSIFQFTVTTGDQTETLYYCQPPVWLS